jgi:hypothetical protein
MDLSLLSLLRALVSVASTIAKPKLDEVRNVAAQHCILDFDFATGVRSKSLSDSSIGGAEYFSADHKQ